MISKIYLTTFFGLLFLSAITLTFMGIIKPSVVIKNKAMPWKRLKIFVFGMATSFVILLFFSSINLSEEQNQEQAATLEQCLEGSATQAQCLELFEKFDKLSTKLDILLTELESIDNKTERTISGITIYDSAAKCIERTRKFSIKDGTLKVISPNEFVLIHQMVSFNTPEDFDEPFIRDTVFILLHTFAHTNLDKLTLHIKADYYEFKSIDFKPGKNLPDLSKYKITLHAKRKDILAYLQKHYQINSFDELTSQSNEIDGLPVGKSKGRLPSEKFVKIYSELGKAQNLINTFKVK